MDRVYVFDVATGALYRDIALTGTVPVPPAVGRRGVMISGGVHVMAGDHMLCPSEEHVLAGNNMLVDIESEVKLWTYTGHESIGICDGMCWFEVVTQQGGA